MCHLSSYASLLARAACRRLAELRDFQENREERELMEMETIRRVEKEAAEKQISRTAEREAREEVNKELQVFNTHARIKLMEATYRARNIRTYTWGSAILTGTGVTITMKAMDDARTVAFDQNQFLIGLIGYIYTFLALFIGWKFGEAKLTEKSGEGGGVRGTKYEGRIEEQEPRAVFSSDIMYISSGGGRQYLVNAPSQLELTGTCALGNTTYKGEE